MSFPRYQEYRDSGIAWLGTIPSHWYVTRVKHAVRFSTGWTPPTGDAASFDGANLWANISDLGPRCISDTVKRISDDAVRSSRIRVSPKGSLLFSFKLSIGQVSFAGLDLYTNEAIATFLPSDKVSLAYAYYAFPLFLVQNAEENIYGAKLLNQELIRSAPLVLPSTSEQSTISTFLDRETAKIDALIAEQQRLMELLQEKRQAVVSHAVTKGLNPDAPMKPSEVEWLGDVPESWAMERLPRVCSFYSGKAHEPFFDEDGSYICVTSRFISTQGLKVKMCSANLTPARRDDTLMVMSDLPNGRALARAFFVSDDAPYAVNQRVCILRPHSAVPKFLFYLLDRTPELLRHDDGANQTHLSNADFLKPRFPIPPLEEQVAIVQYLDGQVGGLNSLINEALRSVDLLQERRSALISAAVTGQIDVRSLARVEVA